MKKLSRSKTEKARQIISSLREQYRESSRRLSEERDMAVEDETFKGSMSFVDGMDLEEGLSGIAEVGDVEYK